MPDLLIANGDGRVEYLTSPETAARDRFIAHAVAALISKMPYLDTHKGDSPALVDFQRRVIVESAIKYADLVMERR